MPSCGTTPLTQDPTWLMVVKGLNYSRIIKIQSNLVSPRNSSSSRGNILAVNEEWSRYEDKAVLGGGQKGEKREGVEKKMDMFFFFFGRRGGGAQVTTWQSNVRIIAELTGARTP